MRDFYRFESYLRNKKVGDLKNKVKFSRKNIMKTVANLNKIEKNLNELFDSFNLEEADLNGERYVNCQDSFTKIIENYKDSHTELKKTLDITDDIKRINLTKKLLLAKEKTFMKRSVNEITLILNRMAGKINYLKDYINERAKKEGFDFWLVGDIEIVPTGI